MEKIRITRYSGFDEGKGDLSSLYIGWAMASNAKNRNPIEEDLCDGKLRSKAA